MKRIAVIGVILGLWAATQAQTVTFYSPTEWLTQRDGKMIAKVQFDTTKVFKKQVQFTLSVVTKGKKSRIGSKSITVDDYSKEVELGALSQLRLGGKDFAVIDWAIPATKEKGTMGPIGIVNLDKIGAFDTVLAKKLAKDAGRGAVAGSVQESSFRKVGDLSVAFAWSASALYVVCKGTIPNGKLTFAVDGKNAKNGYIAYADRFISYVFGKDSLDITHFKRSLAGDTIKYAAAPWNASIAKESANGTVTIEIPWSDIGMIPPTADRRLGCAVFAVNDKGAAVATFPDKAETEMPGTWGDMVFKE